MRGPETKYALVDGVEIAYQVVGDGPVDLVYHHGTCHLDLQWDVEAEARFNRRLASFARLILFDRRGTGVSQRLPEGHPPSWEEWTSDLVGVLDAVGSTEATVFVENEATGPALLLAASHPDRIRSLVIHNGWARYSAASDYPIGVSLEEIEALTRWLEEFWSTPELFDVVLPDLSDDDVEAVCRVGRGAATPQAGAKLARYCWENIDARASLALIEAPTLVIHNESKRRALSEYLAAHLTNVVELTHDGSSDFLFGDDYDGVLDEVERFVTSDTGPLPTERLLATVVFTDIVDSTSRAVEVGDRAWRGCLEEHDTVVRERLRRLQGREVNTTGDGFVASFDSPSNALRFASAATEAVKPLGIELRAGVHTGECERRGDDLAGQAVHLAARLCSEARPDSVYVSRTVTDLVAGGPVRFEPQGERTLKGIDRPVETFSIERLG